MMHFLIIISLLLILLSSIIITILTHRITPSGRVQSCTSKDSILPDGVSLYNYLHSFLKGYLLNGISPLSPTFSYPYPPNQPSLGVDYSLVRSNRGESFLTTTVLTPIRILSTIFDWIRTNFNRIHGNSPHFDAISPNSGSTGRLLRQSGTLGVIISLITHLISIPIGVVATLIRILTNFMRMHRIPDDNQESFGIGYDPDVDNDEIRPIKGDYGPILGSYRPDPYIAIMGAGEMQGRRRGKTKPRDAVNSIYEGFYPLRNLAIISCVSKRLNQPRGTTDSIYEGFYPLEMMHRTNHSQVILGQPRGTAG